MQAHMVNQFAQVRLDDPVPARRAAGRGDEHQGPRQGHRPDRLQPQHLARGEAGAAEHARRAQARSSASSTILNREIELLELGQKIQSQVQDELSKNQREFYLRQQMKAIQKELGEGDARDREIEELRDEARGGEACPRRRARRPSTSSSACASSRPSRPSTPSRAPTSSGSSTCRGRSSTEDNLDIAARPRRSSTRTTTTSRRSRSASSSTSPCAS